VRPNIPNLLSRGFAAIGVNDVVNATTARACWTTKRCRQTRPKIRQSPAEEKSRGLHHGEAAQCAAPVLPGQS
jgi:hypothetical protein